jgi:protocatechuate 3,4-dioxygenase alpha subunit
MTERSPTPSQTIGPFFRFGLAWGVHTHLVGVETPGALVIEGRLLDGAGDPVPDAVVEIWQADGEGRFPPGTEPGWTGFGRGLTDDEGRFRFVTVAPGAVDAEQAPHIDVTVFARGLLQRVVTRLYLPGDPAAHDRDPLLRSIPEPERRATLMATGEPPRLHFDIRLQGERETVFLDW